MSIFGPFRQLPIVRWQGGGEEETTFWFGNVICYSFGYAIWYIISGFLDFLNQWNQWELGDLVSFPAVDGTNNV